jgi:pyruvate dehydrogenase E2 component (dihydrolipoamide acetyltransferase)
MPEVAVRMPKFSMAQEEGTLISWVKRESDQVSAGDVICEVATDKVDMEVEAPVSGRLTRLVAAEDETVRVGEPIAYIASDAADLLDGLLEGPPGAEGAADAANSGRAQESQGRGSRSAAAGSPRALPGARRRAAERGLSLDAVQGTGPGGTVTVNDVEAAADGKAAAAPPGGQVPGGQQAPAAAAAGEPTPELPRYNGATGTRNSAVPAAAELVQPPGHSDPGYAGLVAALKASRQSAIAATIAMSAAIPQLTMSTTLDLELAVRQLPGYGWSTLLARFLAAALRQSPALNVMWRDGQLEPVTRIGVALATDTPIGLVAPVIHDPDQIDPGMLDSQVAELTDAARAGRLSSDALDGATVMLCNLGGFGVEDFRMPLTPPLAVSLSAGTVARRPVAAGDGLTTRTMCQVGLTVDHRVVDATDAARFLRRLRALAANPDQLGNGSRP